MIDDVEAVTADDTSVTALVDVPLDLLTSILTTLARECGASLARCAAVCGAVWAAQ